MALEQLFLHLAGYRIIYLILFILILFEAIPPIGIFIPGQIFAVLVGFAVQQRLMNLGFVISIIALAAILGDWISYELGKHYGLSFLRRYGKYFFLKDEYIKSSEKFMHTNIMKAVITGRLHAITRVFVPFLAGVHKVNFGRFMRANIAGGIIWSIISIFIGYIFGEGYRVAERYFGFLYIGLTFGLVIVYILYHFLTVRNKLLTKEELSLLLGFAASIIIISTMIEDIKTGGLWLNLDKTISNLMPSIQTQILLKISVLISILFSTEMVIICALIVTIYLFIRKENKEYILFSSIMIIGAFTMYLMKEIIRRPRPALAYIHETGFSFPSGHATVAVLFFGLVIYFMLKSKKQKLLRYTVVVLSILAPLIVGFSRIYLNVHYLSDVISGFALGFIILSLSILSVRLIERKLLYAKPA